MSNDKKITQEEAVNALLHPIIEQVVERAADSVMRRVSNGGALADKISEALCGGGREGDGLVVLEIDGKQYCNGVSEIMCREELLALVGRNPKEWEVLVKCRGGYKVVGRDEKVRFKRGDVCEVMTRRRERLQIQCVARDEWRTLGFYNRQNDEGLLECWRAEVQGEDDSLRLRLVVKRGTEGTDEVIAEAKAAGRTEAAEIRDKWFADIGAAKTRFFAAEVSLPPAVSVSAAVEGAAPGAKVEEEGEEKMAEKHPWRTEFMILRPSGSASGGQRWLLERRDWQGHKAGMLRAVRCEQGECVVVKEILPTSEESAQRILQDWYVEINQGDFVEENVGVRWADGDAGRVSFAKSGLMKSCADKAAAAVEKCDFSSSRGKGRGRAVGGVIKLYVREKGVVGLDVNRWSNAGASGTSSHEFYAAKAEMKVKEVLEIAGFVADDFLLVRVNLVNGLTKRDLVPQDATLRFSVDDEMVNAWYEVWTHEDWNKEEDGSDEV